MTKTHTKFLFDDDEGDSKNQKGVVIRVALDTAADSVFDYLLPESFGRSSSASGLRFLSAEVIRLSKRFVLR